MAAGSVAKKRYCRLSWMWSFSYRIIWYFACKTSMTRTCMCLLTMPVHQFLKKNLLVLCISWDQFIIQEMGESSIFSSFLLSTRLIYVQASLKFLLSCCSFIVLQGEYYKITGKKKKKFLWKKKCSLFPKQERFSRSWNVLLPQPPTECVAKLNTSDMYSTSCHVSWCDPIDF